MPINAETSRCQAAAGKTISTQAPADTTTVTAFSAYGDPRGRWPPPTAPQHEPAEDPGDEHAYAVTDCGIDTADQALEQPVARQQRRGQ